jgi:hypothetical protein
MAQIIPDIFEHDIGTHFQGEITNLVNGQNPAPFDISAATQKLIIFKKPDGTEVEYPGTFVTDGTDGLVEYITSTASDLIKTTEDDFEIWEYYGWVAYPNGSRRTSSVKFRLYKGRVSQEGS